MLLAIMAKHVIEITIDINHTINTTRHTILIKIISLKGIIE